MSAPTTSFESAFLSGKVLKRTLPALQPPTGPDAPALKRLLLPQGELAQFHDGPESVQYLAYLELREGTVRGNHYHEVKVELIYLIQGELLLVMEDIDTRTRESVSLHAGDLVVLSPRVAHALQIGKHGHAIEFSRQRFDPADTHRHLLV